MRTLGNVTALLLLSSPLPVLANPPAEHQLSVEYKADLMRTVNGGIKKDSRYIDNLDVIFTMPLGSVGGRRGSLLFSGVYNNGTGFSDLVGDLQGTDNIDAPGAARIYEMWYELPLSDSLSVKGGRIDLNSEFDVLDPAQLFLHSSHGIGADFGQSGENGPSIFPVTTLGARIAFSDGPWSVRAAIFDATPGDPDNPRSNRLDPGGGSLGVFQIEHSWDDMRAIAGYWQYSEAFVRLVDTPGSNVRKQKNDGWYIGIEKTFGEWQSFLRYGEADARINASEAYLGFGAVRQGFRSDHSFGVAVATAFTGSEYRQITAGTPRRERSVELTYDVPINPHIKIQLDLQHIDSPAALPGVGSTLIVGFRVSFLLEHMF